MFTLYTDLLAMLLYNIITLIYIPYAICIYIYSRINIIKKWKWNKICFSAKTWGSCFCARGEFGHVCTLTHFVRGGCKVLIARVYDSDRLWQAAVWTWAESDRSLRHRLFITAQGHAGESLQPSVHMDELEHSVKAQGWQRNTPLVSNEMRTAATCWPCRGIWRASP